MPADPSRSHDGLRECYSRGTMQPRAQRAQSAQDLREENRRFYDLLWSGARLVEPQQFNTWPLVRSLLPKSARRLEVAPGLRPRLPLEDTQFVDISAPALAKLRGRNAHVVLGDVTSLPFADDAFDLVCALDIIEHVDDDDCALSELSRVAKQGGTLLISTPLHPSRWTSFDDFVGHKRRYEPQRLAGKANAAPPRRCKQRGVWDAAAILASRQHRNVVAHASS